MSKAFGTIIKNLGIKVDNKEIENSTVKRVYVNIKNKSITLILSSKQIILYDILMTVKDEINKKIEEFPMDIKIEYEIHEDLKLLIEKYWDNIKFIIRKEIPSSSAWIEKLKWNLDDKCLFLIADNNVAIYTLKNKNLEKTLCDVFKNEFHIKDLNIEFKSFLNENSHEEHYRNKEIEEKNLISKVNVYQTSIKKEINLHDKKINNSSRLLCGKKIEGEIIKISQVSIDKGTAVIEGEIFSLESKDIKGQNKLYIFNVTDYSNSITCKLFSNKKNLQLLEDNLKKGIFVRVLGDVVYDNYSRQLVMMVNSILIADKPERKDTWLRKRVELHVHSQMSAMDAVSKFTNIVKRAKEWGHPAIAITDHGVVQSFPEAMDAGKKYGVKILYGVEGYVVNDSKPIVVNYKEQMIDCEYVVFDIETTGLSPTKDKITEIGATKIKGGIIVDRFSQLVNPGINIPEKIVKLTGITDEMISDKPSIEAILPNFLEFIGDSVLVAHNASFDISFIKENCKKINTKISNAVLDTLQLARELFPQLKKYKLDVIAKHLNISLENHHRAVDDAEATANILLKCIDILKEKGIKYISEINKLFGNNINVKGIESYHIVILAKNKIGLKNLYKIVSEAHLKYFYRKPRIPKSLLTKYREGLILGTACEAGELYKAVLKDKEYKEIRDIVNFYDYLEIQPIGNNQHLILDGLVRDKDELRNINKKIVELGNKYNKPVVATGDVHFLDPQDEIFRRILMNGQGYSDADNQPPLYFKTTNEMIEEFSYLGEKKAEEVVIDNPVSISNMIDEILPIPNGTYPPIIDGAEEELMEMTYKKAKLIYGDPLPSIVKDRLDKELNSIIKNGYAVLYIIAQKLVTKSLRDGYLVGSRGSVGSSFVATMSDITEVNPLSPHYVCPNCKYSEFIDDGSVGSGADLPDKNCPNCGTRYRKDGHNIPFEVFLGFEGDKEPDIDLNFAGEYQSVAHKYTEELFGEGYVFRAGTIGTVAEKTAYGFVKKYFDEKGTNANSAEVNRLVMGCTGIKRTSGQHPGGVMIVPRNKEIYDFSPIQYPADDKNSGVITTHFDYHSISGRILKLDILGHDVPTIIKMLEDLTGLDPTKIPLDDKETIKIFTSTDPLGVSSKDINSEVGTLGIPEFGTKFVRQMLIDTKPTTFAELVRISGLSHGTDVWLNNAQELVRNRTAKLSNVISTRDDIMLYLISNGLDKKRSFKIMEKVRKGKGLAQEDEEYMKENKISQWYIESCKKIKYMFPKAHAVAYVMMSFRIAYFKVHYPEAFYATYFTTKANDFDAELIVKGEEVVKDKIIEFEEQGNDKTAKEKNLLTVLEVVLEMYKRGFKFERVDLYKSDSDKFIIGEEGIIPPLKSLQGVGENAARNIVNERKKSKFLSVEDLVNRAKITKTVVEALRVHGCLKYMSESNQLSLFSI